jgi:hypothetical protein
LFFGTVEPVGSMALCLSTDLTHRGRGPAHADEPNSDVTQAFVILPFPMSETRGERLKWVNVAPTFS